MPEQEIVSSAKVGRSFWAIFWLPARKNAETETAGSIINFLEEVSQAFCCRVPGDPAIRAQTEWTSRWLCRGASGGHGECRSTIVVCNYALRTDNGGISPSGHRSFPHTSILYQPHQERPASVKNEACCRGAHPGAFGGAAGNCPRVRHVSTWTSTAIAPVTRRKSYMGLAALS